MKVKAKANFRADIVDEEGTELSGVEVQEGDVVDLRGATLKFHLNNGTVTKDLNWTPEQRGGQ